MEGKPHRLKASFVIPAHNEAQNVGKTIGELQQVLVENRIPYEMIVVNDNSTDETAEVVERLMQEDPCIQRVDRTPPGGFGRAVRAGLERVTGDLVMLYMADCSDDPRDALAYYHKIEEGYDCVFGSRFRKQSTVKHYPLVKLAANRLVNRLIQILFWCPFNDLTNAFKAYRTEVIQECGPYRASHFNITIEMSLSALVRRYNIAEIPIAWYGRTWGSAHLALREMARRYLSTLLKVFFEKMLIADDLMAERLAARARNSEPMNSSENRSEALKRKVGEEEGSAEAKKPRTPRGDGEG